MSFPNNLKNEGVKTAYIKAIPSNTYMYESFSNAFHMHSINEVRLNLNDSSHKNKSAFTKWTRYTNILRSKYPGRYN